MKLSPGSRETDYIYFDIVNIEHPTMNRFLTTAAYIFLGSPLVAQDSLESMPHAELVERCIDAVDEEKDASQFAVELYSRERFHLGEENAAKGKRCLESVYGDSFVFTGRRFVSPERDARAKRVARELREANEKRANDLEAARRARVYELKKQQSAKESAYVAEVAKVCEEELARDRFRALTTPICGEIFKIRGLP